MPNEQNPRGSHNFLFCNNLHNWHACTESVSIYKIVSIIGAADTIVRSAHRPDMPIPAVPRPVTIAHRADLPLVTPTRVGPCAREKEPQRPIPESRHPPANMLSEARDIQTVGTPLVPLAYRPAGSARHLTRL